MEVTLTNLGSVNKNNVTLRNNGKVVHIIFSYETAVACNGVVRQNDWSVTTGKLLNELQPDKSKRVDGKTFKTHLAQKLYDLTCECDE